MTYYHATRSSTPFSSYFAHGVRTFERLATVSVLMAGLVLLAAANHFGWIIFH
jgi:hypothetical protein